MSILEIINPIILIGITPSEQRARTLITAPTEIVSHNKFGHANTVVRHMLQDNALPIVMFVKSVLSTDILKMFV